MSEPDEDIEEAEVVDTATTAAMVPVPIATTALVEPAANIETIRSAVEKHQEVCAAILDDSDYQHISGRKYRKKSGWRKLAVAYGVSCELVTRDYERNDREQIIRAEVTVRATAPNGRFMDGLGACDLYEKCCREGCTKGGKHRHCPAARGEKCNYEHFSHPQHDLPATAHTRATNRACADLFGLGEVSAEEMVDRDDERAEPAGEKYASTEQYRALADLVSQLDQADRDSIVTGPGELMGVKVREKRDGGDVVIATEAQIGALTTAVTGLLRNDLSEGDLQDATPTATKPNPEDPAEAPFADSGAAHDGEAAANAAERTDPHEKHGYDTWLGKDLDAECEVHGLPKHGTNAEKVNRLRAWDAINRPENYVEPEERPF